MTENLQPGYYWVKWNNEWIIGKYTPEDSTTHPWEIIASDEIYSTLQVGEIGQYIGREPKQEITPAAPEPLKPAIPTMAEFWKAMDIMYPGPMDEFKKWIDAWKDKNYPVVYPGSYRDLVTKYHYLPAAMQLGIFTEWLFDMVKAEEGADEVYGTTDFTEQVQIRLKEAFVDLADVGKIHTGE